MRSHYFYQFLLLSDRKKATSYDQIILIMIDAI
nr:MAG TPA: hypothetical protein [Caudoviricetes sp.]